MRIVRLQIDHWRNFKNLDITVPEGARLIALTGGNGSGKSNILELISQAGAVLGISTANSARRGSAPLQEPHAISLTIHLGGSLATEVGPSLTPRPPPHWDGTTTLISERGKHASQRILLGDEQYEPPEPRASAQLQESLSTHLHSLGKVLHLFLDSDRSYPARRLEARDLGALVRQDWDEIDSKKASAGKTSGGLYDEWIRYIGGKENRYALEFAEAAKEAQTKKKRRPPYVDPMRNYRAALAIVLPYLTYQGLDAQTGSLKFDVFGTTLDFHQLSGGERELAFLVGQIDRFQLSDGLLLLDEPELRLNPTILRRWVRFLLGSIDLGQAWLATHSLEAIETVGADRTCVLEMSDDGSTRHGTFLSESPERSSLARSVGTPAFSIRQHRFLYVEGAEGTGEIALYHEALGSQPETIVIPAGGSREVRAKVDAIIELGQSSRQTIRVGGIVDRDFCQSQTNDEEVYQLGCHEFENLFLWPEALEVIRKRCGYNDPAEMLILLASDAGAGSWLYHHLSGWASANLERADHAAFRSYVRKMDWPGLSPPGVAATILQSTLSKKPTSSQISATKSGVEAYRDCRTSDELWRLCTGKEVLRYITARLGFRTSQALQRQILSLWRDEPDLRPPELLRLQEFVDDL